MTLGWRPRDRVVTPALVTSSVIDLTDMKRHLRVDHDDEDLLISGLTDAAVATVEAHIQRLLSPREVVLQLPGLPCGRDPVELPGGAVQSVASVSISGTDFPGCIAFGSSPALLIPPSDWPVVEAGGYPVTITYTAGYASAPADLVVAVKMICASLYENRQNSSPGSMSPVPVSAEYLMNKHRIAPV